MSQDKSIISVRNLVKRFGDRAVLDGVTVDIPEGKITIIMGGSGCGKSTFLRHLIGNAKSAFHFMRNHNRSNFKLSA